MSKCIKKFQTTSEYNAYVASSDFVTPNVSICEDDHNNVHYTKWYETKVVAKVITENWHDNVQILNSTSNISAVEIDGVAAEVTSLAYFEEPGEHLVKYTLFDNTSIDSNTFAYCTSFTSITMPDSVTSIGENAFNGCSSLTSVLIPSGVTSIGSYAFNGCSGLTTIDIPSGVTSIGRQAFSYIENAISITCNATTPPTLEDVNAFVLTNECPIYVPAESVDAYKAATYWSDYASRIQAIP